MEKIIVCIKGVPKPGTVKVDPETHTLRRESMELILNPNDRAVLEMAARLKNAYNTELTVISMGPPNVVPLLKHAYALGIDQMILLSDRAFAGSDTLATSYVLAKAIEKLSPFSLVLMGLKSIDGETAQVPPETASLLGIPSLTNVKSLSLENGKWIAVRELEYGEEEVEITPPFVASISPTAFNYLRPPSLKRLIEAKNKEPVVWNADELNLESQKLGLAGSPTQVVDVAEKKIEAKGVILEDEPEELVKKLIEILKDKGLVKNQ